MFKWCVLASLSYLLLAWGSVRAQESAAPAAAPASATVHIDVSGEVVHPGTYEVPAGDSVNELLKIAGGLTGMSSDAAHLSHVDEIGRTRRYTINLKDPRADEAGLMREGDSVLVSRASQFSIAGEVNTPGDYRLDPSMTFMQAIQKAGGLTVYGSSGTVVVQRSGSDGKPQTIKVKADDFVEPDDVVRVKIKLF
jgi:protein involved in polysaccharide export with SLBB domain